MKNWFNHSSAFVVAILSLVLSGCTGTTKFSTDVTAFHELDSAKLAETTYAIFPRPGQAESLEYRTYARLVAAQLAPLGWREEAPDKARFLVSMDYGIDEGKVVQYSDPIYGQTGYVGSRTSGTISGNSYSGSTTYTPIYGVVGTETRSATLYTRSLTLRILRNGDLSSSNPSAVYEAKAISKGSSPQLALVMPYMVRSIFADFPGQSGKARTVHLPEIRE